MTVTRTRLREISLRQLQLTCLLDSLQHFTSVPRSIPHSIPFHVPRFTCNQEVSQMEHQLKAQENTWHCVTMCYSIVSLQYRIGYRYRPISAMKNRLSEYRLKSLIGASLLMYPSTPLDTQTTTTSRLCFCQ